MALLPVPSLAGRRVLITGAARGIGAALAERLTERGARVALAGLEPDLLADVARRCGGAPWAECDVTDQDQVEAAVASSVDALGGLDVAVANAGVAAQLPLLGGDPEIMRTTLDVNVMGAYLTFRAAGPHLSHANGYALAVSSLAAAVQPPLLGAYGASKAAVEALGNTLRAELRPSGARVGVAPLEVGIRAIERGIARRSRWIVAPGWVGAVLPMRMAVQPIVERATQRGLARSLAIARDETVDLTTPQPGRPRG